MSRRVAVIVASDRGYSGERKDLSGPEIRRIAEKNGYTVVSSVLLPDDREKLEAEMCRIADDNLADLILTSGGNRPFSQGLYAGGYAGGGRADGSGNPGGHAGLQPADYQTRPCSAGAPRESGNRPLLSTFPGVLKRSGNVWSRSSASWATDWIF